MSNETPLNRTLDELAVQAWLARAELREPSLREPAAREELAALARIRDELALQASLGRMEARDSLDRLESRWADVVAATDRAAHEAGEAFHDVLDDLRRVVRAVRGSGGPPMA